MLPRFKPWPLLLTALLTLIGSRVLALPPVIRSTYFDGTTAHGVLYTNDGRFIVKAAPLTLEAWVYREDAQRCETIVSQGFTTSYWLGFCPRLRFYRSGGFSADADVDLPARQWSHVAASYDGTRVRFYIDGVLAGDKALASTVSTPTNPLGVGIDTSPTLSTSAKYPFRGWLDEVRIWRVARSATEIAGNRFQELRDDPNLVAVIADGSEAERVSSMQPATEVAAWRLSGFGILPRDLVVPSTPLHVVADGQVSLPLEYAGAEQMVIRYADGKNIQDGVLYLVYQGTAAFPNLFLSTSSLRYPASIDTAGLAFYFDPNASGGSTRGNGDFSIGIPFVGTATGTEYLTGGFTLDVPGGASTWIEGRASCQGEFHPPCVELQVRHSLLGTNQLDRLMVQNYGNSPPLAAVNIPSDALPGQPSTWPTVTYGGEVDANLRRVFFSVYVRDYTSWNPDRRDFDRALQRTVTLRSGSSSITGLLISQSQSPTNPGSSLSFDALVPGTQPLSLKVDLIPGDRVDSAYPPLNGVYPASTNGPADFLYDLCPGSNSCSYTLILNLIPPPGPIVLNSLSPTNPTPIVTLRETPLKQIGGGVVRIGGTNLHSQIEVYASNCNGPAVPGCVGAGQAFQLNVVSVDPEGTWVNVEMPELGPLWWGQALTLWVRDRWLTRPGVIPEWNRIDGPGGLLWITPPTWPQLHGFEFANIGAGTSPEEFEAVYGENVFTYIPAPPFKVRDPFYYGFWWWVYLALSDASDGGSCHGFAGTSLELYRRSIPLTLYDNALSGGPSGVHYTGGYYGVPVGSERRPYGPIRWSGFDLFHAFEPRNLWAQIRVNMQAQYSQEGLDSVLSQITTGSSLGGNPPDVLHKLQNSPFAYILCLNPGGIGVGHCINPYRVLDGFGLTNNAVTVVPKPDSSIVQVYDNNWPGEERSLEIPHGAFTPYRYRIDGTRVWSSRSLFVTPLSLFTNPRHAPGASFIHDPDLLFRIATAQGVRPEYTNLKGDRLGWDGNTNFTDAYPGAKMVAPFAAGPTNRETSTAFAFFDPTNLPSTIQLRVYDTRYVFHAGDDALSIQWIHSNAVPGSVDQVRPILDQGRFQGLGFKPQSPLTQGIPMLSQTLPGTNRMIFRLDNLVLPAGADLDLLGLSGQHGMKLVNRSPTPLRFDLKFDGLDGAHGVLLDSHYTGLEAPAGGALSIQLADWPTVSRVTLQQDLNNDGIPDVSSTLVADYALLLRGTPDGLQAEWRVAGKESVLESSDAVAPTVWTAVPGTPVIDGNLRRLLLKPQDARKFFRLRP